MTSVILFVFGTIVGSFLNVVGLRWDLPHQGGMMTNFRGRSHCPHCHTTLSWWELMPVLSFFLLRAKCRTCGAKISWQYPLIELWTGLIFVSLYQLYDLTSYSLLLTTVFCIYVVITIYDFKTKIIPNELVYSAIFLSLAYLLLIVPYSLLNFLAGPIIFAFFASIWLFSGGRAMGFGDAKLGLSVGWLLGAALGFSAIILSFWIGAVSSLAYIFLHRGGFLKQDKELTMKSEIPFAPFIILGAWVSILLDLNILHII